MIRNRTSSLSMLATTRLHTSSHVAKKTGSGVSPTRAASPNQCASHPPVNPIGGTHRAPASSPAANIRSRSNSPRPKAPQTCAGRTATTLNGGRQILNGKSPVSTPKTEKERVEKPTKETPISNGLEMVPKCGCAVGSSVWLGDSDGSISIRSVVNGSIVHNIAKVRGFVWCITKVDDTVWVGYSDSCIRVFEPKQFTIIQTLSGHRGGITQIAEGYNGVVFSAASDFTVIMWNSKKYTLLGQLVGHIGAVSCLAVHHALPQYVFSAGDDCCVRRWVVSENIEHAVVSEVYSNCTEWIGHTKPVTQLLCSGCTIWSASEDSTVRVWNAETGYKVKTISMEGGVVVRAMSVITGKVWTACTDGCVRVLNVQTFLIEQQFQPHSDAICFMMPVCKRELISVWTSSSGEQIIRFWTTEGNLISDSEGSTARLVEEQRVKLTEAAAELHRRQKIISELSEEISNRNVCAKRDASVNTERGSSWTASETVFVEEHWHSHNEDQGGRHFQHTGKIMRLSEGSTGCAHVVCNEETPRRVNRSLSDITNKSLVCSPKIQLSPDAECPEWRGSPNSRNRGDRIRSPCTAASPCNGSPMGSCSSSTALRALIDSYRARLLDAAEQAVVDSARIAALEFQLGVISGGENLGPHRTDGIINAAKIKELEATAERREKEVDELVEVISEQKKYIDDLHRVKESVEAQVANLKESDEIHSCIVYHLGNVQRTSDALGNFIASSGEFQSGSAIYPLLESLREQIRWVISSYCTDDEKMKFATNENSTAVESSSFGRGSVSPRKTPTHSQAPPGTGVVVSPPLQEFQFKPLGVHQLAATLPRSSPTEKPSPKPNDKRPDALQYKLNKTSLDLEFAEQEPQKGKSIPSLKKSQSVRTTKNKTVLKSRKGSTA